MANFRRIQAQGGIDWLLMSPQSALEALRFAWLLWRQPEKAAVLIGCPAGWVDGPAGPADKAGPRESRAG